MAEPGLPPIPDRDELPVTERVPSLDAELSARLQAAQRLEFVGVAVTGVIHDLNNIVTALGGTLEMLRSGQGAPDVLMAGLDGMLRRSRDLTRQLLQAARPGSSGARPLDLRTPVRQASDLLRHSLGAELRTSCVLPGYQVPVFGERTRLLQCLFNLAVNARDAMQGKGELHLELSAVQDPSFCKVRGWPGRRYARLVVWDSGPGIPLAHRARIFEPFFSTKAPERGTGMGLAVVGRVVAEHAGIIDVGEAPGGGASFEIRLPMHLASVDDDEPTRAVSLPKIQAPPHLPLTGLLVLVADDEPALRMLLDEALRARGAEVVLAADGAQALDRADDAARRGRLPDAVLLDLQMPGPGPAAVLAGLRQRMPAARIVAMSGLEPEDPMAATLDSARAKFLSKPFRVADLVDVVLLGTTL
jgi:CheY-like chemotaxis protein